MIIQVTHGHIFTRQYTYTCCTYDLLNSQYSHSHFDNYPIAVSINNKMEKTIKIDLWSLPKILFINGVL